MKIALILFGLFIIQASLAVWMLRKGWRQSHSEVVLERLGVAQEAATVNDKIGSLERIFLRAGFPLQREKITFVFVSWLCLSAFGFLFGGMFGLLAVLVLVPVLGRVYLAWLTARRTNRIIQQLPQMLDQVVRSIQTGRTLGDALLKASAEAQAPLSEAFERLRHDVQLGVPLPDALDELAELYEKEELRVLAVGVRVNYLYGGNASDLLNGLIKVIHDREIISRQLKAMTGETRMTAIVLAVIPVGMVIYIMIINPNYLLHMWLDDAGRKMLIAAFAFQVMGCLAIWRMLRSI